MKNLVLHIERHNWGEITSGDWQETKWNIYDDYTVEVKVSYVSFDAKENYKEYNKTISKEEYCELMENIELAKNCNEKVEACDGEAWSYAQYNNEIVIWKREIGYVYGIEPLEKLNNILYKIQ